MSRPVCDADMILVGGGLANTLIALALHEARPGLRLMIFEAGATLGANHTWSFHTSDLTGPQYAWLAPLIIARWPRQEVRFPSHAQVIETGYNTVSSERLHEVAAARLGAAVRLDTPVTEATATGVTLADGRHLSAPLVIDGRGALQSQQLALGYQKFIGLEVETASPHGRAHPVIMDATVAQRDGYRFVYTLPFSPTRVLIEDTYYSDTADLEPLVLEANIHAYAAAKGWTISQIVRREQGILPIALAGRIDEHWRDLGDALPRSGLRAWLFHATTGYSLPCAVRLAEAIAQAPELGSAAIAQLIQRQSRQNWQSQSLFRLLNRCLFLAADPLARIRILEQFYRLPRPVIERFYAGALRYRDTASLVAIMAARPPVPIGRALSCVSEASSWRFAEQQAGARSKLG